jgi:hypothetical protein
MPGSNGSLVVTIKPTAKENVRTAAMLLLDIYGLPSDSLHIA